MPKAIWISWERHRRTSTLAEHFGIPLHTLLYSGPAPVRYLVLSIRATALLIRERPGVLVVQNPSIVLATLAVLLRPVFGYRLLVDAHNEAVEPYANAGGLFKRLSGWLLARADATIVTNAFLAEIVTRHGGRPLVLPDKVPEPAPGSRVALPNAPDAVLIATFAADEPIEQIGIFLGAEQQATFRFGEPQIPLVDDLQLTPGREPPEMSIDAGAGGQHQPHARRQTLSECHHPLIHGEQVRVIDQKHQRRSSRLQGRAQQPAQRRVRPRQQLVVAGRFAAWQRYAQPAQGDQETGVKPVQVPLTGFQGHPGRGNAARARLGISLGEERRLTEPGGCLNDAEQRRIGGQ